VRLINHVVKNSQGSFSNGPFFFKDKERIMLEKERYSPRFEISVCVRDLEGNPTDKRKTFVSDYASEVEDFYQRHIGKPKDKKRTKGNK